MPAKPSLTSGTEMTTVGRVGGLWRYPIKSLDGERLDALTFDRRGVERDREWALAGPGWTLRREAAVPHFDAGSVHLVTSATLATLTAAARWPVSVERLRPNVLIELDGDGFPEDGWLECTLSLGSARLRVTKRVVRCVMLNQRRPNLRARRDVRKLVGRLNKACAGVYADVVEPGEVRLGDPVTLGPL